MQSPCKNRFKDQNEKPRKSLLQLLQTENALLINSLNTFTSNSQNFLSCNDLHQLLTEYSIQTTNLEITELINKYGKNNNIPISTLKKILSTKVNTTSKSVTFSPNKRISSFTIEKSILDKSTDTSLQQPSVPLHNFFQSLENQLKSHDLIIDYFFLHRSDQITLEDFSESCNQLLEIDFDLHGVFNELADKNFFVTKTKFFSALEGFGRNISSQVICDVRMKLKKKFKSFLQAFESLKKNGVVQSQEIFALGGVRGVPSGVASELSRFEFKKFWFNKESICKVDFCIEKVKEYEVCDMHFKGFILRGEETLRKISAAVGQDKCVEVVTGLLTSLNKRIPFTWQGVQKREVQALQIYLKYKQDKKLTSINSTPC